jgi:hypothetical protein
MTNLDPVPEPTNPAVDDLGLTADERHDLQVAYQFGTMEPAEGTVEAQAFARMADYTRRDFDRASAGRAADEAYERTRKQPFPGGPLTVGLTSRESIELCERLARWYVKADRAVDVRSIRSPAREMARELFDLYKDVDAEVVVSGTRGPLESEATFIRIVHERQAEDDPEAEL